MNIAMSFAIKKKRILVIDGDLRHGSTSSYVDSPKTGLSDYLGNRVSDWKEIIVKDEKIRQPAYHSYRYCSPKPDGTVGGRQAGHFDRGASQRV